MKDRLKNFWRSKLKAASFIFALVGWFLLFVTLFGFLFESFLLDLEAFIETSEFTLGLQIFVVLLLVILIKWQGTIDRLLEDHKWMRDALKVVYVIGAIGWVVGLGSLLF